MLKFKYFLLLLVVITPAAAFSASSEHHHHQHQHHHSFGNLSADKIAEIRALENPLPKSADVIAKGEEIYKGKGGCANCHGQTGGGDGPLAAGLNPPPRNFQDGQFWAQHKEGEVFWTIKHGVQGTAMPAFKGVLTDKEIWSLMRFLPTFASTSSASTHSHGQKDKMEMHQPNTSEHEHGHMEHEMPHHDH